MYDTGDPEGLLSTLPAFAGSIIGMLAGTFLFSARLLFRKSEVLAGAGAVLAVLGWVWGLWLPLNKNLWTSSFALFSTGTAMMIFSGFLLAETRGLRFSALEVFGRNALLSYFGSGLIYGIFDFTDLKLWVNSRLFAGWMSPQNASLAFALALTGFCWGGVSLLERRGLTLKI
jgi:predicted acyltransferase